MDDKVRIESPADGTDQAEKALEQAKVFLTEVVRLQNDGGRT